jgi:hypothetical protein
VLPIVVEASLITAMSYFHWPLLQSFTRGGTGQDSVRLRTHHHYPLNQTHNDSLSTCTDSTSTARAPPCSRRLPGPSDICRHVVDSRYGAIGPSGSVGTGRDADVRGPCAAVSSVDAVPCCENSVDVDKSTRAATGAELNQNGSRPMSRAGGGSKLHSKWDFSLCKF